MTSWKAEFLQPGGEPGLLRLLQGTFDPWPKVEIGVYPLDHLKWKLGGGEHGGYRAAVVKQGDEIVGGIVLCIREVSVNGAVMLATTGGDVAVLPEYRSQGVLSAIQELTLSTVGRTVQLTFGYQSDVPAVTKVAMNPGGQLAGQAIEILGVNPTAARTVTLGGKSEFRVVGRFDERIDNFWNEASKPFDFIPARTMEYLNWRYCDPRAGLLAVEVAEEQSDVVGYAVAAVSNGRGHLADLLALPGRDDIVAALVDRALAFFAARGIETVHCWIPEHHLYKDVLARLGFASAKGPMRLMYRPLLVPASELEFLGGPHAALHFTLGDTDLV